MVDYYKKYLFGWTVLHVASDASATVLAWIVAYFLRFEWGFFLPASRQYVFPEYMITAALLPIPAIICYFQAGLYNSQKLDRFHVGCVLIWKGMSFLIVSVLAALFFYRDFSFSRLFALYFILGTFGLIVLFRAVIRRINRIMMKRSPYHRRTLLIGTGRTAKRFMDRIGKSQGLPFQIIDCVSVGNSAKLIAGTATVGDIPKIIQNKHIDEVFIALDMEDAGHQKTINLHLSESHADVNLIPDIYHSIHLNPMIIDLNGIPVMALRQSLVHGWHKMLKRVFDITGASFALVLFGPAMIVVAILVKQSSKGSVIYSQRRTGLDGKDFFIHKFRSMKTDAEKNTGAVWATKKDARITRIGAFLRKTSLDEFPQFFNVLKGEMSLVGPRPERPELIAKFTHTVPNYILRHKAKAGITGWAQVNGWRGNTSLEKRIEHDLYYIANWSIWFDVKIILLTVKQGFIHPNAY